MNLARMFVQSKTPVLSTLMIIASLLFASSVMADHVVNRDGDMVEDEASIDRLAHEVGLEHGALDLMKKYNITESKLKELLNLDAEGQPKGTVPSVEAIEPIEAVEHIETAEPPEKNRLKIGGAIRSSYVYGDYKQTPYYADSGPLLPGDRRGRNVGGFMFDTFRINVDLEPSGSDGFIDGLFGKFEYRWWWYLKNAGYSSLSKAWLGYESDTFGTFKAGIVRVPFGPGPYGVSSSWFFDQHFYVGLSDDRDTGLTWTKTFDNLTLDLAYFLQAQPNGEGGTTRDAIRYDYDVAKWDTLVNPDTGAVAFAGWPLEEGTAFASVPRDPSYYNDPKFNRAPVPCDCGFQEKHQFNLRAIYAVDDVGEFGASFQYGMLEGTNIPGDSDGTHFAVSTHAKNPFGDFTLYTQLTYYQYNITDNTPWGTGDLIPMGGYDYAWLVASRGWIPAVNLRYTGLDPNTIWPSFLSSIKPDSITPYIEWSSIMKLANVPMDIPIYGGNPFNDNSLLLIGASWVRGGWYIYSDFAMSTGNLFVGNDYGDCNFCNIYDTGGGNGASGRNDMQKRLNINFGYYF